MTIARDTTMGEAPSYGIATGNRFAMVDIGDDIEDPAEFYNLIEQSNAAKKDEKKKKKEKKPEKKKEEEKKPEKKGIGQVGFFECVIAISSTNS